MKKTQKPLVSVYPSREFFLESQGLPPNCDAAQFSDSVVCPCGVKFDVNDPCPPKCPYSLEYHTAMNTRDRYRQEHPGPLEAYRRAEDAARASGIAVHELSDREVSQAQRRLFMLYSEPGEDLWRIVDTGSKWFMWAVIVIGAFVVGWAYGPLLPELFR